VEFQVSGNTTYRELWSIVRLEERFRILTGAVIHAPKFSAIWNSDSASAQARIRVAGRHHWSFLCVGVERYHAW
jgi:hypothetical protein